MAFGKFRRSYRRNYRRYRRGTSRLSTSRVLTRRSSIAQARQIIALRRRVNRVYKATKPEVKVFTGTTRTQTYTNNLGSDTYSATLLAAPQQQGTDDFQFVGNLVSVRNLRLLVNAEYNITENNSVDEPSFHKGEASFASLRIIVVQPKQPTTPTVSTPPLAEIISYNASSGNDYSLRYISPLARNFSTKYKLLADAKIPLNVNSPEKNRVINIRPFSIRYSQTGSVPAANFPIVYIVTSGLHFDANFTDQIRCTWAYKIAYTDA